MSKNFNISQTRSKTSKVIRQYFPIVLLITIFLIVFVLKAFLYDLISGSIFSDRIFNSVPDDIFYILTPIYYIIGFPMLWLMYNIPNSTRPLIEMINNSFIAFTIDIFFTIFWMIFLFYAFRFIVELITTNKFRKKHVEKK